MGDGRGTDGGTGSAGAVYHVLLLLYFVGPLSRTAPARARTRVTAGPCAFIGDYTAPRLHNDNNSSSSTCVLGPPKLLCAPRAYATRHYRRAAIKRRRSGCLTGTRVCSRTRGPPRQTPIRINREPPNPREERARRGGPGRGTGRRRVRGPGGETRPGPGGRARNNRFYRPLTVVARSVRSGSARVPIRTDEISARRAATPFG